MAHIVLNKVKSLPPEICVSLGYIEKESEFPGRRAQSRGQMVPCSKGVTIRTSVGRMAGLGTWGLTFHTPFLILIWDLKVTPSPWHTVKSTALEIRAKERDGLPACFLARKKPAQALSLGNGLICRHPMVSTMWWGSQTSVTPQQYWEPQALVVKLGTTALGVHYLWNQKTALNAAFKFRPMASKAGIHDAYSFTWKPGSCLLLWRFSVGWCHL